MDMSDRDAAGLRGPVAVCETEHLDRGFITRESFRCDGKLTERWGRSRAGSEWNMMRRYDADGRLLEESRTGPPPEILMYKYDAKGRLERVDARTPEGAERVHESYLYYDDQTCAMTLYIEPPPRDQKTSIGISMESMLHKSPDAVCIVTVRDSMNRPVKEVLYDSDNRVIRRVRFRYDDAGRLLEEGEVESGDHVRADMRNLYRYDAAGNCIEAELYWGAFGGRRKTRSYNEPGDLNEERVESLPGEVDVFQVTPWRSQFEYEYDAQGNWSVRTEQVRTLDAGVPLRIEVTRRKLTYWDSLDVLK